MSFGIESFRRYFNWFGPLLVVPNLIDRQVYLRFIRLARLTEAESIVELGAGTGFLAGLVVSQSRGDTPGLTLLEVSDSNLAILRWRFGKHADRIHIQRVSAPPPLELSSSAHDRFISCFVIEMMDRVDQLVYMAEAHRLLEPGGLFCCMAVEKGDRFLPRITMGMARRLSRISPWLVLGARFGELEPLFDKDMWRIDYRETVTSMGFATRIILASKLN